MHNLTGLEHLIEGKYEGRGIEGESPDSLVNQIVKNVARITTELNSHDPGLRITGIHRYSVTGAKPFQTDILLLVYMKGSYEYATRVIAELTSRLMRRRFSYIKVKTKVNSLKAAQTFKWEGREYFIIGRLRIVLPGEVYGSVGAVEVDFILSRQ